MGADQLQFGLFTLDLFRQQLLRGGKAVPLRPKTWAVLVYLATHAGQLVTIDELLDEVWRDTVVTPELPGVSVRELRRVLGDDPRRPQYIETVPRRGYRFVGEIQSSSEATCEQTSPAAIPPPQAATFVGREAELAALQKHVERALQGMRQVVLVAGEAGVGKTALVDVFVRQVRQDWRSRWLIARAQCLEQHCEAYLPLLDLVLDLHHNDPAGTALRCLHRFAPQWLSLLPELADAARREIRPAAAVTPKRMMRSLAQALETLAGQRPLFLVLEDLHTADASTTEFLSYLGDRTGAARMIVVATYRPVEAKVGRHPLCAVRQGLLARQRCAEMVVERLSTEHVRELVERRWPDLSEAKQLVDWLYARTAGLPLLIEAICADLQSAGAIAGKGSGWQLRASLEQLSPPTAARELILERTSRFLPSDQALLDVASACGLRFSAAEVAAALGATLVDTDDRLHCLASEVQFLRELGRATWPDGTVSGSYEFPHSLYYEVLYRRLAPARAAELHRAIGLRLEQAFGTHPEEVSVELARHFTRAGEHARACRYHRMAADRAARRFAPAETVAHLTEARAMLEQLPATEHRTRDTLEVGTALGAAWVATKGYASDEALEAFEWALRGNESAATAASRLLAFLGVCTCLITRAQLQRARSIAQEIAGFAALPNLSPTLAATARNPLAQVRFFQGEIVAARAALEEEWRLLRGSGEPALEDTRRGFLWIEPGVACLNLLALALALSGHTDEAEELAALGLARAQASTHPFTLVSSLTHGALLAFVLRHRKRQRWLAEEAVKLAADCGFPFWVASASNLLAHATAMDGEPQRGMDMLDRSLAEWERTGTRLGRTIYGFMRAEVQLALGDAEGAEATLLAAMEHMQETGERVIQPELYRLLASVRARRGNRRAARADLARAVQTARWQRAALWEQRARMDLASSGSQRFGT